MRYIWQRKCTPLKPKKWLDLDFLSAYRFDGSVCGDGIKTVAGPGDYLFLPRGIPHGIRVSGPTPTRMLILAMPGNGFLGMATEMGEPARERALPQPTTPDMAKLVRLCAKYEIEILGPLPG